LGQSVPDNLLGRFDPPVEFPPRFVCWVAEQSTMDLIGEQGELAAEAAALQSSNPRPSVSLLALKLGELVARPVGGPARFLASHDVALPVSSKLPDRVERGHLIP